MVLVLDDNFEFVLAILMVTLDTTVNTESTAIEAVGTLWTAIELCYEVFVRARLINNQKF